MKNITFLSLFALVPVANAYVYAPVPQQQLGQDLVVSLESGVSYDSNVLGGNGTTLDETGSAMWSVSPEIGINMSITDQTFLDASYRLDARYYEDRDAVFLNKATGATVGTAANDNSLYNHTVKGRISHSFDERFSLSLADSYRSIDDPQTLLAVTGPVSNDQSFNSNVFDARFNAQITETHGVAVKYRNSLYSFDEASLAKQLDRNENLFGLEYGFTFAPGRKVFAEYRFEDISYDDTATNPSSNSSDFYLIGLELAANEQLFFRGSIGARSIDYDKAGVGDDTSFYANFIGRYNYADASYVSAGLSYDTAETATTNLFTGEDTLSLFCNLQHKIGNNWYAGTSISYSTADLNPNPNGGGAFTAGNIPKLTDDRLSLGLNLTWQPNENWAVIGSYDLYNQSSSSERDTGLNSIDSRDREQDRHRVGINVRYSFGSSLNL